MSFNVRQADLGRLNSLTKYPSIPTYHEIGERGVLQPVRVELAGRVSGTEKIDGTNSRLILLPGDGPRYLIGSREELLFGQGDLIGNPAQGIVAAIRETANRVGDAFQGTDAITALFFESYGGNITAGSKQYTGEKRVGVRLFDAAVLPDYSNQLGWAPERIAAWRESGGQRFHITDELDALARELGIAQVPLLFQADAAELPAGIEETLAWMREVITKSRCVLDPGAGGRPEGIVVRTLDRSRIVKLRFEDYERTLRARSKGAR